ncbi:MAG: DUF4271 domain-containing protein [Cyclobacteriaceae bacterium]|nr:MAG: DUF4271 domain-containing protein [Cyclobacteriaceae bacterium]
MSRFFLLLIVVGITTGLEAQHRFVKKNLQSEWQVFDDNAYRPFTAGDEGVHTIYIRFEPDHFKGDTLNIASINTFSLFIQGKLWIDKATSLNLAVDSLNKTNPGPIWLAVHADQGISSQNLTTHVQTSLGAEAATNIAPLVRAKTHVKNFIVVAGVVLLAFFVLILRLNPRLTFYYFSVSRLFAMRESDEGQFTRVASSANILFYLFASMLIAYGLMVTAHQMEDPYTLLRLLKEENFGMMMLRWLYTTTFVLTALFVKALVIRFFAVLFDIRDQSGFHFIAFVRVTLLIGFLVVIFVAGGYLIRGASASWTAVFYAALLWFLIGWSILIFLKLLRRVNFSVFHLFSYLCATEVIPFLVTIKVLYE